MEGICQTYNKNKSIIKQRKFWTGKYTMSIEKKNNMQLTLAGLLVKKKAKQKAHEPENEKHKIKQRTAIVSMRHVF